MQALNLRQVADALPSTTSAPKLSLKPVSTSASPPGAEPPKLPSCFAPILRRLTSTLPHHRLQRTTLESVALTLPPSVNKLSGSSLAAAYMAALVTSLNRLISTSSPVNLNNSRMESGNSAADAKMNKKTLSKMKFEQSKKEQQVTNLSIHTLLENGSQNDMKVDTNENQGEHGDEEGEVPQLVQIITSFISLISMSLQDCTHAIINLKVNDILSSIISAYNHTCGYVTVAHHANTVFASVLSILNTNAWSTSDQVKVAFITLLKHTCDEEDEAFRENSCKILNALFHCPRGYIIISKTSALSTNYFVEKLTHYSRQLFDEGDQLNDKQKASVTNNLLVLTSAIENYKSFFNSKDLLRIISNLMILALKDSDDISQYIYSTISSFFSICNDSSNQNSNKEQEINDNSSSIKYSDLSKLLLTLLNHDLPEDCSDEIMIAYTTCIASGTITFIERHDRISPPDEYIFKPVQKLFLAIELSNGKNNLVKGICKAFGIFLNNKWFTAKPKILSTLMKFMDTKYQSIWMITVPVLRKYLENGMCCSNENMKPKVQQLVKQLIKERERAFNALRGVQNHPNEAAIRKQIEICENVLKSISRGGGTSTILSECPIQYDVKQHVTNGWILSILKDNINGTQLSSYVKYLVPIGQKLDATMKEKLNDNRVIEAKNIAIYKLQIWSLLPGFCTNPNDLLFNDTLTLAFQGIHLCFTVDESENLFNVGCQALKQLSLSILKLDLNDPIIQRKMQGFLLRFKKLFPILNNVILDQRNQIIKNSGSGSTNSNESNNKIDEKKNVLFNSIGFACKATHNEQLVTTMLRKTIKQLLELQLKISNLVKEDTMINSSNDDDNEEIKKNKQRIEIVKKQQQVTADLAITIMESNLISGGAAEMEYLEKAMNSFFLDKKENALQKKAFKLSSILISNRVITEDHDKFMSFIQSIGETYETLAAGAKAARISWIKTIVNHNIHMENNEKKSEFLAKLNDWFLSEIILCTRDASEKCRTCAYETLIQLARAWYQSQSEYQGLKKFFLSVCAALGGKSPLMLASCLSCIGKLLETFRYEIANENELSNFIDSLFVTIVNEVEMDKDEGSGNNSKNKVVTEAGPIAILMKHKSVEVQKAAVAVVKIASKCCSEEGEQRLKYIVGGIIPGLVYVAENSNKKETRLKVRLVIERLMRKCGYQVLQDVFPEAHKKLLSSIRKQFLRERNKKIALKEKRMMLNSENVSDDDNDEDGYMAEDDDQSDDDDDDDDDDVERDLLEGEMKDDDGKDKKKSKGDDEVVDLLENKSGFISKQKRAMDTKANKKSSAVLKSKLDKNKGKGDTEIKYSEDGKPIFVDSDNDSGGAEAGSMDENDDDVSDDDDDEIKKGVKGNQSKTTGKRRFDERGGSDERHMKKVKGTFGEEYQGRRGGGDVKRANRPDPFAYVPLGPNMFAAGSKPGVGGKRSRGTALDRLTTRRKQVGKRKGKASRAPIPGRR